MIIRLSALPSVFICFVQASTVRVHLTSTAAHPAFRKTCSMLVYSFNIVCLFFISSDCMYKRTTSEPKGEVARVKLV